MNNEAPAFLIQSAQSYVLSATFNFQKIFSAELQSLAKIRRAVECVCRLVGPGIVTFPLKYPLLSLWMNIHWVREDVSLSVLLPASNYLSNERLESRKNFFIC